MRLALKQLKPHEDAEMLRRELEVLSALRHPNLVAVYGVDIATWSRDRESTEVLDALASVLRALCLLHDRGRVHGDIKPGNILVSRSKTPKRSDIYSVAVLALELLTGTRRRAFGDDAAAAVDRQIAGRSILDEAGCELDEPIAELLRVYIALEDRARPDTDRSDGMVYLGVGSCPSRAASVDDLCRELLAVDEQLEISAEHSLFHLYNDVALDSIEGNPTLQGPLCRDFPEILRLIDLYIIDDDSVDEAAPDVIVRLDIDGVFAKLRGQFFFQESHVSSPPQFTCFREISLVSTGTGRTR